MSDRTINDNDTIQDENPKDENIKTESVKRESSLKRRLKHGSVAILFTVLFVALIFVVNVVATAHHRLSPMMIDMTNEQIFQISDAAREHLQDINVPVEIVFFRPIDLYEKEVSGGRMIVNIIRDFASEFDFITIDYVDIIRNPAAMHRFTTSDASRPRTDSIAIMAGNTPRLLTPSAFFVQDSVTRRTLGFAGERILTATILQVTNDDSPLALFTVGHGETMPMEFIHLLVTEGFRVDAIDLSVQEIPEDARLLVINNPLIDFRGADPENPAQRSEIDAVASFLNRFGHVMYFTSPLAGPLPELDGLLREWNIEFLHFHQIVDRRNSLDTQGLQLSATHYISGGIGDELHASIRALPTAPRTIVERVKPMRILELEPSVRVSPVLKSADTAQIYDLIEETSSPEGTFDLLVMAARTQFINNESMNSFLLASGSHLFLERLVDSASSNDDIILNALRIMTRRRVTTDVPWRRFDSTALSMTIEQQGNWTMLLLLVAPSIPALTGFGVWLKRRHS